MKDLISELKCRTVFLGRPPSEEERNLSVFIYNWNGMFLFVVTEESSVVVARYFYYIKSMILAYILVKS